LRSTEWLSGCSFDAYFGSLAQAALPNLGHQRNPVRLAALQAIAALMSADGRHCGGALRVWAEQMLPTLLQLTNDRTPAVRLELGARSLLSVETSCSLPPCHAVPTHVLWCGHAVHVVHAVHAVHAAVRVAAHLLHRLRGLLPAHRARLLMLLLAGVADPSPSVCTLIIHAHAPSHNHSLFQRTHAQLMHLLPDSHRLPTRPAAHWSSWQPPCPSTLTRQ
jgi:hypothetical protein